MYVLIIVTFWIICGIIAAGYEYGYFQRRYAMLRNSPASDALFAMLSFFLGPIGLIAILCVCGVRYGWKLPCTKLTPKEWDKYVSEGDKKLFRDYRPD